MKKMLLVVLAVSAVAVTTARGQYDTLGRNPFVYVYDFPVDSVNGDSVHCSLSGVISFYGGRDEDDYWRNCMFNNTLSFRDYAVYMHTEDTLRIVGFVAGHFGDHNIQPHEFTLYDSSMRRLAVVRSRYMYYHSSGALSYADTGFMWLLMPGATSARPYGHPYRPMFFEDSSVVEVVGDF